MNLNYLEKVHGLPELGITHDFDTWVEGVKNNDAYLNQLHGYLKNKKGLDKDTMGLNSFFIARDKSVGAEGVPGYSADFPRAIMQYIMVASNQLSRNRYMKDKINY